MKDRKKISALAIAGIFVCMNILVLAPTFQDDSMENAEFDDLVGIFHRLLPGASPTQGISYYLRYSNGVLLTYSQAATLERGRQSVFVEDMEGNIIGYSNLEERKDGRYDLSIWTEDSEARLEISGLAEKPEHMVVRIDSAQFDRNVDYMISIDPVEMETAEITLPRTGNVSEIMVSPSFDSESYSSGSWESTDISFTEGRDTVTFEVTVLGGYGVTERPDVFTVTTTRDSIAGSLRQAIMDANEDPGLDMIEFSIPADDSNHVYYRDDGIEGQVSLGNVTSTDAVDDSFITDMDPDHPYSFWSITPRSELPHITDPVIIEGYTQPGAVENTLPLKAGTNAVLRIEISGIYAGWPANGLVITGGASTIRGLAVNNYVFLGIQFIKNGGNTVEGCFIGTDVSGTKDLGNFMGLSMEGIAYNTIGGTDPKTRNIISGNDWIGLMITGEESRHNSIYGNLVGTNARSTPLLGNSLGAVVFEGSNNAVGGTEPDMGNIIAGNDPTDVWISGENASNNTVTGNFIDTEIEQDAGAHGNIISNNMTTEDMESHDLELLFVDASVEDYESLLSGLARHGIIIEFIESDVDGIEFITESLSDHKNVTAVHILSHGDTASIDLGTANLNAESTEDYAFDLIVWDLAMVERADILIYGCNVAGNEAGKRFIERIAELTGADTAASDDLTGSAEQGGDWDLEFSMGGIETDVPFTQETIDDYSHILGENTFYDMTAAAYNSDPRITSLLKGVLVNGLTALATKLGTISGSSHFTDNFIAAIPALIDFVTDPNNPAAPDFGTLIGDITLDNVFQTNLVDEVNDNFTPGTNKKASQLVSFMDGLDTTVGDLTITIDTVSFSVVAVGGSDYQLRFDLTFNVAQSSTYSLNLGRNADILGLKTIADDMPDIDVDTGFTLDLTFGTILTLTVGDYDADTFNDDLKVQTVNNDFFIRDTELNAEAHINESGIDINVGGGPNLQVGFLEIEVEGGTFTLDGAITAEFVDPDSTDPVTLTEITGTAVADLVDMTTDGDFEVDLPVARVTDIGPTGWSALFGGLTLGITLEGDPFDPSIAVDDTDDPRTAPSITLSNDFSDYLLFFNNITPDGVLGLLQQFQGWLGSFGVSQLFSAVDIPFADAQTLANVLDFFTGFDDLVASTFLSIFDPDEGITTVQFASVQELIIAVGNALGMTLSSIAPDFDLNTQELTFTLDFDPDLPDIFEIPIDFAVDLSPLAEIQTNVEVSLEPYVGFSFTMGVDLSTPSEIKISPAMVDYSLRGLMDPDTGNPYTPANGQLTEDAKFRLILGLLGSVDVIVEEADTTGNASRSDLADDIELAIEAELAIDNIVAEIEVDVIFGNRIRIFSPDTTFLKIEDISDSTPESEGGFELLGFNDSQVGSSSPLPRNGILSGTASFDLTVGQGSETTVNITQNTAHASSGDPISSLIGQIRTQVSTASSGVVLVQQVGDSFALVLKPTSTEIFMRVNDPNNTAFEELGLRDEAVGGQISILGDRTLEIVANALPGADDPVVILDEDASVTLEVDGDSVTFTVHAAKGVAIGFCCNQSSNGVLTANKEIDEPDPVLGYSPGVDVSFELFIEDDSHIVTIPKSITDANGDIYDMADDMDTAFTTAGIDSLVEAGTDASGKKLTISPKVAADSYPNTYLRVSPIGNTQDNVEVGDLVDDLNIALSRTELSDGTPLGKVVVGSATGEDTDDDDIVDLYKLILSVPSVPKDTLEVTAVTNPDLGFGVTAPVTVVGPPSDGQLSDDAVFSLTLELKEDEGSGTGPFTWEVTVTQASTSGNSSITDLIEDINTALTTADPSGGGSPEDISDRVTAGVLVNKVTLSARDDNTKMLRTSGTDSEAQDELGLDDGITAAAREEQGFLFIRDVGMSGGVNLVVNTTDTPAVSAHFGFVGIDINTVQGTLGAYGTDVAVHGGVAINFGGIKSVFELESFDLNQDASFEVSYIDNKYDVTLEWEDTIGNSSIGQLVTNLQDAIDAALPGSHTVTVGNDGDRLTLTTSNGERLRLEVVGSDPAATALGFANGQQTGRINLEDLTDATSDFDILDVLVNVDITGEAGIELSDVVLQPDDIVGGLLDELGIDPRIEISMSDFLDFDSITITGLDLGAIADGFDDFEFSDVTAALQIILNLIADFADFDFLDEPLPVVGVTINDILEYIQEFIEMIEEMAANPASIVQDIEQLIKEALGLPSDSDAISLSLDTGSTILRIDLAYDKTWNGSLALDVDLEDLLGISLPDELINLSGAADLEAEFSVTLGLGLGIDLDNPTDLYVYDNTGIFLEGYALADNVNFTASLGPFGIFITGGKAVFNEDGDTTNTDGAYFNLTAFEDPDTGTEGDRVELGDVDLQAELAAGVGAILPCHFPTASNFIGNLDFYVGIAVDLFDPTSIDLDPHLNSYPDFENILPDISSFSLIESLQLAVEGLDLLLYSLEKILGDDVLGAIDIPLIGDSIDDAAEFIEDVRREVIPELRAFLDDAPQKAIDLIQQAIFYALGPPGLDILVLDPNWHDDGVGNSSPDHRDVQYTYPPSEDMLQFNLQMGGHYAYSTPEIDVGLPGLGFSLDGGIEVALDWDMLLCFGISRDDGFYLDTTPLDAFTDHLNGSEVTPQAGGNDLEHMFEISLSVTLPEPDPDETTMTGSLLFLQLDIRNQNWPDPSLEAFFAVDVTSGPSERLGFASIPLLGLDFDFGVQADLDLDMSLGIVGGDVFPHIDCNFQLMWGLGDGIDTEHPAIPYLAFNDVGLNLGSFFSEFLAPVVKEIQKVTKPLEPIIEVLTDPIPVISDLAGEDISLVDIAASFGLVDPGFIEAVADLISFINSIPSDGSDIIIGFGSFDVGGDGTLDLRVGTALDAIRATPASTPLSSVLDPDDFESLIDSLGDYDFSTSLSAGLGSSSASASTKSFASKWSSNQGGFSFPLFTDPGQVFGMFLGRSADVFFYDMPKFTFGFTYSQFFPIWDGLGAEITGTVGCSIDLSFGYDTFGIQKFADGGYRNPLDLLRGFYIGDIDFNTGADIPEVSVFGSLTGAAVLNLVVASVGVGGGVYATIDFNLNDPDGDGKVRIEEIIGNVCNGFKQLGIPLGLICIFDVAGKVWARLFAFIKIDLLFFKFQKTWYFGPSIPLVEFEYSCPKDPVLATDAGDGVLRLNMGKYAQDRLYGDTSDGPEDFHVKWKSGDTVQVWSPSHGVGEGSAQEYSGVTKIMADTGQGNDKVDLSRVTASSITSELRGDSGDDTFISGAGEALFYGGVGNDILVGGDSEDTLYGEEGSDTLIGNDSDDLLEGGEDDDILAGDDGQDTLLGEAGNDLISGGGDGDVLRGGAGKDGIWGDSSFQFDVDYALQKEGDGSPSVTLIGTEAEDHITGDGDPDEIYGDGGTDMISGGGGPDVIDAGSGADKVWGDSNFEFTDNVLQFDGPDPKTIYPLYATAGGDIINGGSGADILIGEDGNDEIHGDDGNDEIFGDRGSDILYGDDDNDDIYGDLGNDRMFGNDGDDTMDGEGDNDVMFGDDGEVAIIAGQETLNLDLVRTINPTVGGDDEMDGGTGDDIMLGGPQTDTIYGGTGDDRLLGDNGELDYTFFPSVVYSYVEDVVSTDLSYGDRDYIYGHEGADMIIGGEGSDDIFGDAGSPGEGGGDVILGDNGHIDYTPDTVARWSDIALIETTDTAASTGGNDDIDASEGPDIVMGGVGADTIIGSLDDDIILGDSGLMDYDTGDADLSTLAGRTIYRAASPTISYWAAKQATIFSETTRLPLLQFQNPARTFS
jgi:Ca2+-binding RTX toxin-like protein